MSLHDQVARRPNVFHAMNSSLEEKYPPRDAHDPATLGLIRHLCSQKRSVYVLCTY